MKVTCKGEMYELPYHTPEELEEEKKNNPEEDILAAKAPMGFVHVWKKLKVKDLEVVLY